MNDHVNQNEFYSGKKVLVTGHSGFKGRWLTAWLARMDANVVGLSLPASDAGCETSWTTVTEAPGDIRDVKTVDRIFAEHEPQIVFHLAAQSLVRESYADPQATFATNVQGTANVLDSARRLSDRCAVVVVTSDKCYENREWVWGYRESDRLGGFDPYSASKACAELVTAAYRNSFFESGDVSVASVRAGNVIGGGDWAAERIVPDFVRAIIAGNPITLRSPRAVRPWQHVLEPLRGYLMVAERLWQDGKPFAEAWNFGPGDDSHVTVKDLVDRLVGYWGRGDVRVDPDAARHPHETNHLALDCRKSRTKLGWRPLLSFDETIAMTVNWYRHHSRKPSDAAAITARQISDYENLLAGDGYLLADPGAANPQNREAA